MTYYDGPAWSAPGRQASWDQPAPPSRSGASSSMSREDTSAFASQFEEVERAIDNLNKGGKLFLPPGRRESVPMGPPGGRPPFNEFDPRMGPPSRHHSVDFDPSRPHSASNVQGFYANQRYQPRHNEADQMQQAKRRMAAQRERELRNYHQEQQYNRSVTADVSSSQGKSDRSNSPSVMNEDERRELIARQHKALYGNEGFYEGGNFSDDGNTPRPASQTTGPLSARGHSPMTFNNFGPDSGSRGPNEDVSKGPSPKPGTRSRSNSNSSPTSGGNQQNYASFDPTGTLQQSSRTSTSSPGTSPPRQGKATNAPAPIGTRPTNPALNKRATPPASSPLSFGFDSNQQAERASSAASNPVPNNKENSGSNVGWGSSSGVWNKGGLGGVQAPVWG